MALRTVGVRLAAEVTGYINSMRQAGRATGELRGELDRAARAGRLDEVADQAGRFGLTLAAGFGAAVAMTAKFDKQMSEVGAVSDATGKQMDQLRQAALNAGKATAFSATEAAEAEAELAKAGLSTSQILGGALSGSLSLAAAGSLDLAEAADISAKTMNVFKLEGKDVGHIADVLAASANKSATDVHEMGEALKQGGLAAQAAGMGLEETAGTLAAFADNALNGSDAGTSLKTALMMLQAPSGKAADTMKELGINAYDAQGNFIGTAKLAGVLQRALGDLTQEQRNAALATIFGADGMRAANILYNEGEQGIQDYVAAVNDQGAAAEVAAKKMDNLAGDVEKLKGSLETMAIESGSGSTSGLRTLVQGADNLVGSLSGIPAPAQHAAVMVAGVSGAALLAAAGAAKMRAATARAGVQLAEMGPRGGRAAAGLDRASKAAGRAGIALAALQVASALGGESVNAQTDSLVRNLEKFGATGERAGEVARVFGGDMGKLDQALSDIADTGAWSSFVRGSAGMVEGLTGLGNAYDASLQHSRERLDALDQALAQMVQSGHADQAKAAFDRIAESAGAQGISVRELNSVLPGYAAAVEGAGSASGTAAPKVGEVGTEAKTAAQKVDDLKAAFDRLFGERMSHDRALIEYRQGIKDLNKELETGKRTLDTTRQAGRDNATAVLDQIGKIKDLRQANIDNNMSIEDADAAYKGQIGTLRTTLLNLGYNEEAVDDLIGKYKKVPDDVATDVSAPGAAKAKQQVQDFNFAVKTVPPSKTVPFYATTAEARAAVATLKAKINELKSKHIYITGSVRWTSSGDLKVPGGTQVKDRWGGVHEGGYIKAAQGVLRDAAMFGPRSPGRYMFAEPETGGEAFIPKYGDKARSRSIWSHVGENWLGMRPAAAMQPVMSGGGSQVYSPIFNVNVSVPPTVNRAEVGREVVEAVKAYERSSGPGWRK